MNDPRMILECNLTCTFVNVICLTMKKDKAVSVAYLFIIRRTRNYFKTCYVQVNSTFRASTRALDSKVVDTLMLDSKN